MTHPRIIRLLQNILVVILFVGFACPSLLASSPWRAGTARRCITPEQFMWMAGYGGRDRPAEGKYCDLWAKSLVLQDATGRQAVLISLDLVGIDRSFADALYAELEKRFGLPPEQVAICVTHTHTGPVVGRCLAPLHYLQLNAAQQQLVDQYLEQLRLQIVACVGQAIQEIEPCRLSHGSGHASFAVNRRNNPEPQVPTLRTADKLVGPVDHDVPVLAVRSLDGQLKTILFGYACHATVLSDYKWSGDYPGFAALALEASHPGSIAMFWAGCGADQNPLPRRKVELARQYGQRLADTVSSVLKREMNPLEASLSTRRCQVELRLDTLPTTTELVQAAEANNQYLHAREQMRRATRPLNAPQLRTSLPVPNRFVRARAEMLLQDRPRGQPLADSYSYPIGFWVLGNEIQFIFLGGEVVVDYANRLKTELNGSHTWVAGYAHDVMAYIPSERVLTEGGYEGESAMVYYGLPTAWKPGVESDIIETVHRMARKIPVSTE